MSHVINKKDRNSKVKARKKENVTVYGLTISIIF